MTCIDTVTTLFDQLDDMEPKIPQEEIERVKKTLRDYTERVTSGEIGFSTLARFYSEDEGSRRRERRGWNEARTKAQPPQSGAGLVRVGAKPRVANRRSVTMRG